jgi:hypothetical protein
MNPSIDPSAVTRDVTNTQSRPSTPEGVQKGGGVTVAPSGGTSDVQPHAQSTTREVAIRAKDTSDAAPAGGTHRGKAKPVYSRPPTTRAELQAQLSAPKPERDKSVIARMINTYRPNVREEGYDHTRLASSIKVPLSELKAWAKEISRARNMGEVEGSFSMAFKAGSFVPLGSFLSNVIVYGAIPFGTSGGAIWQRPLATGVVAVMQPLITSLIQPYVVQGQESYRAKHAPMYKRPGEVKGDKLATEISKDAKGVAAALESSAKGIDAQLRNWLRSHDMGELSRDHETAAEQLATLFHRMEPDVKSTWLGMRDNHIALQEQLYNAEENLNTTFKYEKREEEPRVGQIPSRVVRTAGSFPGSFMAPSGTVDSPADRLPEWSSKQVTGMGVGISLAATFAQLPSAGFDEEHHALPAELLLQVLSADVLTAEGNAVRKAGGTIGPEHVDDAKCDKLYETVAEGMVSRVKKIVTQRRDAMQRQANDMGDLPGSTRHNKIGQYERDISSLGDKRVTAEHVSTETGKLLDDLMKSTAVNFWRQDGTAKLMARDFPVQLSERAAVTFMLGVLGNFAGMALSQILLAAMGGREGTAKHIQIVLQGVNILFGVCVAALQFTAAIIKSKARAEPDMGFVSQTLQGIIAPATIIKGRLGEAGTKKEIAQAFATHRQLAQQAIETMKDAPELHDLPEAESGLKALSALVEDPTIQRFMENAGEGSAALGETLPQVIEAVVSQSAQSLSLLRDVQQHLMPGEGVSTPLDLDGAIRQLQDVERAAASISGNSARVEELSSTGGSVRGDSPERLAEGSEAVRLGKMAEGSGRT